MAPRDDVRGFARPQQRARPQRREAVGGGPLGQVGGLRAADVVERDRLLALEAALEVVGGPAVAGQIDAGGPVGWPLGCGRSAGKDRTSTVSRQRCGARRIRRSAEVIHCR